MTLHMGLSLLSETLEWSACNRSCVELMLAWIIVSRTFLIDLLWIVRCHGCCSGEGVLLNMI